VNNMKRKPYAIWATAVTLVMLLVGMVGAQISIGRQVPRDGVVTGIGLAGLGTSADPLTVDTYAVPSRLSATASLNFAPIAQSACQELPMSLFGAVPGDEVVLGAPTTIDQGFVWSGYVSSADTVTVRMCKITSGAVAPVVLPWRATIIKSF
jgi:hypothetical protein